MGFGQALQFAKCCFVPTVATEMVRQAGAEADIAVFRLKYGKFGFLDSGRAKMVGDKKLFCVLTVRKGQIVWDTEGLAATEFTQAGPYTNFR